ncbi:hypothetical protein P8452_71782 [Trifolium repens]|nr:hypothetical protein P8452_71782 [Trifolium repens]
MEGFGKHELSLSLSRVRFLLKRLDSSQFVDSFRTTKLDVSLLKKLKTTLMKLQVIFEQLITYKHAAKHWPNLNSFYNNIVGLLFGEIDTEAVRCKVEATTGTSNSHFKRLTNYRLQNLIEGLEFVASGAGTSTTSYDLANESSMQLPSLLTSVKVLLDRLDSTDFINNFGRTKLDVSLLENLKETLLHLEFRFGYAEENHLTNFIGGHWLDMLRNVVFEVGYFFDEINLEALQSRPSTSQVLKNLSSPFKLFNGVTNSEFQKLIERLEFLISRARGQFHSSLSESALYETPTSSILDDESSIYGRDTDVKKLKHLMLSPDCGYSKIGMISIVGIEGIGKTTLAKLLYNDPEVYNKFEVRVWAHVSNHFADLIDLATILDDLNENRNDTGDGVNTIYLKLLLVLDELRDARSIRTLLLKILNVVEKGSRIIITTQDERVALSMETFVSSMQTSLSVNYLRPLEIEDSWSLLARHAFGAKGLVESSTDQEKVGEEYFDVLVSRSLIHRRSIGDEEANFEMHDIIHDFATEVSSSYCINMDEHELHDRVHNLSYNRGIYDSYAKFDKLYGLKETLPFEDLQECEEWNLIGEGASEKSLSFLRSIKIWDCNEFESFPSGGLATPKLVYFAVWKCEKLQSLPEAMNTLFDLQEMEIDNLPNLQSFVIDDLPISLQELTVGSVGGILRKTEPTWDRLKYLSILRIKVSCPELNSVTPASAQPATKSIKSFTHEERAKKRNNNFKYVSLYTKG